MSKTSKMVFVAFTQHCIQSTGTHLNHVEDIEDAKYYCTLYTGSLAPPGGKAIYLSLPPCGFSGSLPVSLKKAALLTFLDLTTTRVIAGKMHSQSPILKSKGALSNPVILTYLWEQSCILHTLNKLPA